MSGLSDVKGKPAPQPPRVMVFGVHGVGKSTFAAGAPSPIVIQTEDGLGTIDVPRFPLPECFGDVLESLNALEAKHDFRTVVVDSLDWLEKLIWKEVCGVNGVKSIEDIGYAKGYKFALDFWDEFFDRADALRRNRNMAVILLAHSRIEKFDDPEHDSYSRYVPALHPLASAFAQQWADDVLFAAHAIAVRSVDEGFGKKSNKGIGSGERILKTEERPGHAAKNRHALPYEMPLAWKAFAAAMVSGPKKQQKKKGRTDGQS